MKFDCHKPSYLTSWHKWFAWYPVTCDDNLCHWLEFVERKGERQSGYDSVEWVFWYRLKS